jgi:hypothetical protein
VGVVRRIRVEVPLLNLSGGGVSFQGLRIKSAVIFSLDLSSTVWL